MNRVIVSPVSPSHCRRLRHGARIVDRQSTGERNGRWGRYSTSAAVNRVKQSQQLSDDRLFVDKDDPTEARSSSPCRYLHIKGIGSLCNLSGFAWQPGEKPRFGLAVMKMSMATPHNRLLVQYYGSLSYIHGCYDFTNAAQSWCQISCHRNLFTSPSFFSQWKSILGSATIHFVRTRSKETKMTHQHTQHPAALIHTEAVPTPTGTEIKKTPIFLDLEKEFVIMPSVIQFLLNNAYEVDAKAQETKLRQTEPNLLGESEHLEWALKEGADGRDKSYFTTHRILVKDGKGSIMLSKKRKNFRSIPYASIQGFCVTTAGVLDDDTELEAWGSAGNLELSLSKGKVNLFGIQQFLSLKVLALQSTYRAVAVGTPDVLPIPSAGGFGAFTSWVTGDASTSNTAKVEERLKTETPILLPNEKVQLAFQTGRDYLVFTTDRVIRMDVQGMLGKRVSFESILWNSISSATVTTSSGLFDRDMEMTLHTTMEVPVTQQGNNKDRSIIGMDFRKGNVDIFAVQKMIANQILGIDKNPLEDIKVGNSGWSWANLFDREASRPIDPKVMDRNLRSNPPLLQGSETVEIAFKGIRDMIVFTTKRLIIIDPKGITGKRVEYNSIPYKSMLAFAIETAGAIGDLDTEVMIWTDMNCIPPNENADPPEPAKPGKAFFGLEFNKKLVNLVGLKKYLSQRILSAARSSGKGGNTNQGIGIISSSADGEKTQALPPPPSLEPNESLMANFFSYFTGNQRAIDPKGIDDKLHKDTPLLIDDEHVVMAFQAGRDLTLFTNLRVMIMDVQGLAGKRISYRSIPLTSIRAFSVESAGAWDSDSELDLYTGNTWDMGKVQMDFRKGHVDILTIHRFLSAMIMGDAQEVAQYLNRQGSPTSTSLSSGGIGAFINWLGGDFAEQDAAKADSQLHADPAILMAKEKVEKVYKSGRDMLVYTSHRVIVIDVQGIRGKKVEYLTIPHEWIHGFEVETAGHLDRDAEVYLKIDIPAKPLIQQDVLVKRGDVMEVQKYLTEKLVITD